MSFKNLTLLVLATIGFLLPLSAVSPVYAMYSCPFGNCCQPGDTDYCTPGTLDMSTAQCTDKCSCTFTASQCGQTSCWEKDAGAHNCTESTGGMPGCVPDSSCGSFDKTAVGGVIGTVTTPSFISKFGFGTFGLNNFLDNLIGLIYWIAGVLFVFMIIFGAFQWITSGGDKESVGKARGRITHAIIGIALLGLAFVIIRVLGHILGLSLFAGQDQ